MDLDAGTTYNYSAYNKAGCSSEDTIASTTFTTKLAKPTLDVSVASTVSYGSDSRNQPSGTGAWYERFTSASSTVLGGSYTPVTATCATGTTLEVGWYSETDLTTRIGREPIF